MKEVQKIMIKWRQWNGQPIGMVKEYGHKEEDKIKL